MTKKSDPINILKILETNDPLTGFELQQRMDCDVFELWRDCCLDERIHSEIFSRRYLRLDRKMKNYARLSPSIRREFLTYTILSIPGEENACSQKKDRLTNKLHNISLSKRRLARESMIQSVSETVDRDIIIEHACFIIAGDIVYNMAHDVPRPESSTGEMVRGSDLDIIIIHDDRLDAALIGSLDEAIFSRKHYLLVHPSYREEIDYIIKDINRVKSQTLMRSFEDLVACKILWEGEFMFGNSQIFEQVQAILHEKDVFRKMEQLHKNAIDGRKTSEQSLLASKSNLNGGDNYTLFYTQEEHEEIY